MSIFAMFGVVPTILVKTPVKTFLGKTPVKQNKKYNIIKKIYPRQNRTQHRTQNKDRRHFQRKTKNNKT
tara:strand:- start:5097 stop:5303 length:207 start_codon:yes stop_codon:yes gene_type:complete